MMLPKKKRLTSEEFNRFFQSGRRVHGTFLQLVYTPYPVFHGAAVVGKKVYKGAVKRNKVRRRIYDALYRVSRASECTGVYMLIAKPAAAGASYVELSKEVVELTQRVRR